MLAHCKRSVRHIPCKVPMQPVAFQRPVYSLDECHVLRQYPLSQPYLYSVMTMSWFVLLSIQPMYFLPIHSDRRPQNLPTEQTETENRNPNAYASRLSLKEMICG